MDNLQEKADVWSNKIIGAAIEVHREMGPGLLESIYEKCLVHECELQKIPVQPQLLVDIGYKNLRFDDGLRVDMLIDGCLLVELKAVETVLPIHKAQLYSYMKLQNIPVGLLINFHETKLVNGLHRLYLSSNKIKPSFSSFPSV